MKMRAATKAVATMTALAVRTISSTSHIVPRRLCPDEGEIVGWSLTDAASTIAAL
jgi:hypothetical protein